MHITHTHTHALKEKEKWTNIPRECPAQVGTAGAGDGAD